MKLSVVLIWLCVSSVQLQRPYDKPPMENGVQFAVWSELREMRDMMVKQKERLEFSERQIEELKQRNAALERRVASAEVGVATLKDENPSTPKVAFSFASGLNGYYGPVKTDTTIVFRKQITNVGKAFSPITGVFTAPLRGVYYFRFSVHGYSNMFATSVNLFKNDVRVIEAAGPAVSTNQYTVGGVTLQLEKGDLVYIKLLANSEMNDSSKNHSTFSGFLVFPL